MYSKYLFYIWIVHKGQLTKYCVQFWARYLEKLFLTHFFRLMFILLFEKKEIGWTIQKVRLLVQNLIIHHYDINRLFAVGVCFTGLAYDLIFMTALSAGRGDVMPSQTFISRSDCMMREVSLLQTPSNASVPERISTLSFIFCTSTTSLPDIPWFLRDSSVCNQLIWVEFNDQTWRNVSSQDCLRVKSQAVSDLCDLDE